MRIMSLLLVPSILMVFCAGALYPSWWTIGLMGWATVLQFFIIGGLYNAALGTQGESGLSVDQIDAEMLCHYIDYLDLHSESFNAQTPVYVATNYSGIVPAHEVYVARFEGQHCLIIGSNRGAKNGEV